jgi:hypothetical protein
MSLLGNAPCTSSMVFRDAVSYIVSTVNYIRNMASSITNWRSHIVWGFSNDISILFDLFVGYLGFEHIFS